MENCSHCMYYRTGGINAWTGAQEHYCANPKNIQQVGWLNKRDEYRKVNPTSSCNQFTSKDTDFKL